MPVASTNFTTGAFNLPDTGELSYNGCTFSPLFQTNVSGKCVKDDAQRTVKFMEYTITVDGYVTLPNNASTIAPTMDTLRSLLTAQGGALTYKGRGNDITINVKGGKTKDAAWGPIPELLDYQPMGGCKSAKVKWTVIVHIVEPGSNALGGGNNNPPDNKDKPDPDFIPGVARAFPVVVAAKPDAGGGGGGAGAKNIPRLLQFNYESTVTYNEDYYATLNVRGVLEIPLTRDPTQQTRTFAQTADNLRGEIERRVMSGIDLRRFRMVKRNFNLSRDKRTLNWDFQAEEKSYMDLPLGCPVARGSYNVRPAKAGMGLATWMCTLRCTYTVRKDAPRRIAWNAFLSLLRVRMAASSRAVLSIDTNIKKISRSTVAKDTFNYIFRLKTSEEIAKAWKAEMDAQVKEIKESRGTFLIDFSVDEGMYLDSKTTTFSATWKLVTNFSHILLASGIWKKTESDKLNLWHTSIKDVSGAQSWFAGVMPTDVIVDFGGG